MGAITSRLAPNRRNENEARNPVFNINRFEQDNLRATGTYFGPNFVLESNGISPEATASLAYWEDIVNVLSIGGGYGRGNGFDIPGIGNIYSQLPPAELKTASAVQSNVNIQKSSLRINRIKESATLRYNLTFKFDTMDRSCIKIYWGAKEVPVVDGVGNVSYRFVDKDARPVEPWCFGPFESGLNQEFTLPSEYVFDNQLLKRIGMGWVSDLNLLLSPVIYRESQSLSHSHISRSTTASQPLIRSSNEVDGPISVVVQSESPVKARKQSQDPYHLLIKIETTSPQETTVNSQYTFMTFSESNERQLEVHFVKQLLTIKGMTYVLQEIYGFSESQSVNEASHDQMSQKECVVCMADTKDTIVLPCRHLCLCTSCANLLRMQGRANEAAPTTQAPPKCPICRQIFHSLLSVSLPAPYQSFAARGSRISLLPPTAST